MCCEIIIWLVKFECLYNDTLNSNAFSKFCVQGNFHQGDVKFGINLGKQCVANCLVALVYSKIKRVLLWNQCDCVNYSSRDIEPDKAVMTSKVST